MRVHDVRVDELPAGEFDLVHARLLLAWLTNPDEAARRLAAALNPGGWLLSEEMDFVSVAPDPAMDRVAAEGFERVVHAHNAVLAERHAFDPFFGRRLAGLLTAAGLVDVATEGRAAIWHGGGPGGTVWRLTLAQLREPMVASGLVSATEVDDAIALCDDPRLRLLSQITMAAWGRRG